MAQNILLTVFSQGGKTDEDLMLDMSESEMKVCCHGAKHWSSHLIKQPSKLEHILYKEPKPSFINLYVEVSVSGKIDLCNWNCS